MMSTESRTQRIWPLPVAVVAAITVFASTFFAYAERQRLHQGGSYFPAGVGIGVFSVLMFGSTVAIIPKEKRSVGLVFGIVAAETAVFAYAIMFLLLNIYGS